MSRAAPAPSPSAPAAAARLRLPAFLTAHRAAAAGVVGLVLLLDLIALDQEGYANSYYAAAVLSMSRSWHNFFFAAFDPGGFLAVDKPPLGLWLQVASVKLLGFGGFSLLLPQALAGAASVAVLTQVVGRSFGPTAGLLAGLALAVTPVAVVVNRNNTMDSTLVLLLVLATWAGTVAVERGGLRLLLAAGALVGLAFNVKSLEAYLVVPGLAVAYLAAARLRLRTRLWHLVPAAAVLLVVSLSWVVAVDLTPASRRPYVTDSGSNSELSLLLGYNGLGRVTSAVLSQLPNLPFLHLRVDLSVVPAISPGIGDPGALRLLDTSQVGQVGWLLPLAVLGLAAVALQGPWTGTEGRRTRAAVAIWGGWLAVAGAFFSFARFYHLYYLVALAPPVAAAAGFGAVSLWRLFREGLHTAGAAWWRAWLLPVAIAATTGVQANTLAVYPGWPAQLAPVALVAGLAVAGLLGSLLVGARLRLLGPEAGWRRLPLPVTATAVVGLLLAPAGWSAVSVAGGNGGAWLPQAGPSTALAFGGGPGRALGGGFGGGFRGAGPAGFVPGGRGGGFVAGGPRGGGFGALTFAGPDLPTIDPGLVSYLERHRGGARYLVATMTSSYASLLILDTGQPVMTLGGYQGWDRILTPAQLAQAVRRGTVRFFLVGDGGGGGFPGAAQADVNANLTQWLTRHCTAVSESRYQTSSGGSGRGSTPGTLYDCG